MGTATKIGRKSRDRIEMPGLTHLSAKASGNERVAYIRTHARAMQACGRRTLQHAWLVGLELAKLKKVRMDLTGARWDRYLRKTFDFGERQSSTLMRLAKSFPTCRSLPPDINSIRGAIESLRINRECDAVEARPRTNSIRGGARATGERVGDSTGWPSGVSKAPVDEPLSATFAAPSNPIPPAVRRELQAVTKDLWELARTDRAALKRVRVFVTKQCRGAAGKAKRPNASRRRAG